eukprot:COSAG03_NODE_14176_length_473_cov_330.727273_1_plen_94_part_10
MYTAASGKTTGTVYSSTVNPNASRLTRSKFWSRACESVLPDPGFDPVECSWSCCGNVLVGASGLSLSRRQQRAGPSLMAEAAASSRTTRARAAR